MRITVEKYLLLGAAKNKELFFTEIQKLGIAQFFVEKQVTGQRPAEVQLFIDALHVLRQMAETEQVPSGKAAPAHLLARQVVELKNELEQLQEKERILRKEIDRVAIFGHFSVARLQKIAKESGRVIQFFFAKEGVDLAAKQLDEVIYIGSSLGMDYFTSINKVPQSYEGFVEILIERSLSELESDLAQVRKALDEHEIQLSLATHHKKLLHEGLLKALDQSHLKEATKSSSELFSGELFVAQCWIPQNKISLLEQLAEKLELHIEPILPEEGDRIPTYLENQGTARLGEDLVGIYDTPSIRDRDPSNWVFYSFALFFSMIVGDAGYGLILLTISLYLYKKFGAKMSSLGKRVVRLSCALSIGCIFWGAMTSSFLGMSVPVDSPIRSISFVNWMVKKKAEYLVTHKPDSYQSWVKEFPALEKATSGRQVLEAGVKESAGKKKYVIYEDFTDNVMMELAIFIGTLHIMISLLRYVDRNWASAGWVIFLIGGYLYFPLILKATSLIHYVFGIPYEMGGEIGFYLIFAGMGLASLLALIQNKWSGLAEIMQVISVFADVMSYLRIYALSLAGMIMAATFNDIAGKMPIYIGIFILLAGHTINFVLALMGGLIHGLRLNFIEWYHYSFEGGGKHFSPLALLKKDL